MYLVFNIALWWFNSVKHFGLQQNVLSVTINALRQCTLCVLGTKKLRPHLPCRSPVYKQRLLSFDLCVAAYFGIDLE